MCLEGLGLPRAGSLLPVLRGAGPHGDQHEEKKVAVVLRRRGAESQLCIEGRAAGNKHPQTACVQCRGLLNADIRATYKGEEVCCKGWASSCAWRLCTLTYFWTNNKFRYLKSVIPQQSQIMVARTKHWCFSKWLYLCTEVLVWVGSLYLSVLYTIFAPDSRL